MDRQVHGTLYMTVVCCLHRNLSTPSLYRDYIFMVSLHACIKWLYLSINSGYYQPYVSHHNCELVYSHLVIKVIEEFILPKSRHDPTQVSIALF